MLEKLFFKIISCLLLIVSIIMMYYNFLFNIQGVNDMGNPKFLIFLCVLLLAFLFKFFKINPFSKKYIQTYMHFVQSYKLVLFTTMVVFQLFLAIFVTLIEKGSLDGDAGRLILWANTDMGQFFDYLTRHPNNTLISALYLLIKNLFALQIINIIVVDLSILYFYFLLTKIFNKNISILASLFFALSIGISPFVLIPYTDTLSFPFALCIIHLIIKLTRGFQIRSLLVLAVTASLSYLMKPSLLVYCIAGVIIIVFTHIKNNNIYPRQNIKNLGAIALCVLIFFSITNGANIVAEKMSDNAIKTEQAATMKSYFAMGLLNNGGYNFEFRKEYWSYGTNLEARDAFENSSIKTSLNAMGKLGLLKHLVNKIGHGGNYGSFSFTSFDYIISNGKFYRSYIEAYKLYSQAIWLLLLLGLASTCILSIKKYGKKFLSKNGEKYSTLSNLVNFAFLTLFGGVLFLLLFEWGSVRYLIQFFPCILILSALGWGMVYSGCGEEYDIVKK